MLDSPRTKRSGSFSPVLRVLLLASALVAMGGLAACNGEDEETSTQPAETSEEARDSGSNGSGKPEGRERAPESAEDRVPNPPDAGITDRPGGGESGREPPDEPEVETPPEDERGAIADSVARYIEALTMRRASRLCRETFVPGALEGVRLPERRGSCRASLRASIGAALKRGGPRWRGATLNGMRAVIVSETGDARVTAGVGNRLQGSKRTWVEDDVIYLRQTDEGEWRLVKPSGTFYRAVGYPDVPLSALAPPD